MRKTHLSARPVQPQKVIAELVHFRQQQLSCCSSPERIAIHDISSSPGHLKAGDAARDPHAVRTAPQLQGSDGVVCIGFRLAVVRETVSHRKDNADVSVAAELLALANAIWVSFADENPELMKEREAPACPICASREGDDSTTEALWSRTARISSTHHAKRYRA